MQRSKVDERPLHTILTYIDSTATTLAYVMKKPWTHTHTLSVTGPTFAAIAKYKFKLPTHC